jgi:Putative beta barrel porin-7 (BBP7)
MNRRAWTSLARLLLVASFLLPAIEPAACGGDFPSLPILEGSVFSDPGEVFDGNDCGPGLYGLKETMFWGRTVGSGRVAVIRVTDEATAAPGTPVFAMNDLAMNFQPGMRIVAGWRQDSQRAFEVSYFGIFNWHDSATVSGNNNLALPGDLGLASQNCFAADEMKLVYRSQLNNAEANVIGTSGDFSLLGGFRYLSLYEKFNIRSTDLDSGTSNYHIRTTNNLFGGQLGTRYRRSHGRLGWDATGKAGLFGNNAGEWQFVTDSVPGAFLRDRRTTSGAQVAFVGDINVSAYYRLFSFFTLRAGYNVLWVDGVALAPGQLDFTNTATSGSDLRSGDGFFAQGVSAGGLADW